MINLNKLLLISQENMLFPVDNIEILLNHLGLVMPLINTLPNVTFLLKIVMPNIFLLMRT